MKIKSLVVVALWLAGAVCYPAIVTPGYEYGALETEKSYALYENELIRLAEFQLIKAINKFRDNPAQDKAVLLQADIDMKSGNYNIADANLTEFIITRSNSPLVPAAALQRAFISYQRNEYRQAEINFSTAYLLAAEHGEVREGGRYGDMAHQALFWQGMAMAHQGKHLDAKPVFTRTFSEYPEGNYSDDAIYSIGRIHEVNNENDSAIKYFDLLQEDYPKSNTYVISLIRESANRLALRKPSTALQALEHAENVLYRISQQDSLGLTYEPQSFTEHAYEKIIYMRGEAYNNAGRFQDALGFFEKFKKEYQESVLYDYALLGAGWSNLSLGWYSDAINNYDQIISRENDDNFKVSSLAKLYRVLALKGNNQREQAKKELAALSVSPAYPYQGLVLLELGQMQYEEGKFDNALKTLERAEREAVEGRIKTRIHLLLGACYLEFEIYDKALKQYELAEKLAENSDEIYMPNRLQYLSEAKLKAGICLVQTHRNAQAIPKLMEFIGKNKGDRRLDEAVFWLGEAYFKSEMLQNSIETFDRLLSSYPASPRREEALYGKGWAFFRQKKFSNSSSAFSQLMKEFPDTKFALEVLTRQGDANYLNKNYSAAVDAYRKASKMAPGTEEGLYAAYQMCDALYKQGSFEQAISALLDLVRMYPKSSYAPYSVYLIGWIRFQQGKYEESIDNFRYLLNSYNNSTLTPRAHYAIGDAYYNAGRYEEAMEAYKIVIEGFPTNALAPEAIKSIQYSLIALGREEEAIEITNNYVQQNPESPYVPDFIRKTADNYRSFGKYTEAVDEYKKYLNEFDDRVDAPEVMYYMARSYLSLNETEKAEETFNNLAKKYPESDYAIKSVFDNAVLQMEMANIFKADSIFKFVKEKYPESDFAPQAGFERAALQYRLGDTIRSLDLYRSVAAEYPETDFGDQSNYRIAMHFRGNGTYDSARVYFGKIAVVGENPRIASEGRYRIGELYMREENYVEAAEQFAIVRDKFEGYEDWYSLALLGLGQAYEELEKFEEAREVYNALDALRPEDDFGKTAKSRLNRIKDK